MKGRAPINQNFKSVNLPRSTSFRLRNGLQVHIFKDSHLPAIRFNMQVRAGVLFETKLGLADAVGSLLSEGTTRKSFEEISESLQEMGGNLSTGAGPQSGTILLSGLKESEDVLIRLLADVVLTPSFPERRLAAYKYSQSSSVNDRASIAADLAAEVSRQVFYGGSKYAQWVPTQADREALSRDDLIDYHRHFYIPDGAVLCIGGDVDVVSVRSKLESAFANWKSLGKENSLPPQTFGKLGQPGVYLVDQPNSLQSLLNFQVASTRRRDPDYIPLIVANQILGGGSASRLFQNIRERKGYAYGAYSILSGSRWPGIWSAVANVRSSATTQATTEFFAEIQRLGTTLVSQDELTMAKRSLVGGLAMGLESKDTLLDQTISLYRDQLSDDYWSTYPRRVMSVTAEQVREVARKYFDRRRIQLIVVGDRNQVMPQLGEFGEVQVVKESEIRLLKPKL